MRGIYFVSKTYQLYHKTYTGQWQLGLRHILEMSELCPQLCGNGMLRQLDRLLNTFGPRETYDRRGNTLIAQRELQRRRRQGNIILAANLLYTFRLCDICLRRSFVGIARICLRPLSQYTAAIRCCIDGGDAMPATQIPEAIGGRVEQGIAVVRDRHFEEVRLDEARHQVERATGDAEMGDQTLLFTFLQHLHGSARYHGLLERYVLGIVQVHELNLLQAKQAQTTFDAATHLVAAEIARLQVAISLGGQHKSLGQATDFAQYSTNAPLALSIPIRRGGIDEFDGSRENGAQRLQRPLLPYRVIERSGHISERRGSDAEPRHL